MLAVWALDIDLYTGYQNLRYITETGCNGVRVRPEHLLLGQKLSLLVARTSD